MEDCIVYIVFQLRQAGFEVKFTWPNILYISWKHHEGDYLTTHNPIVQAMLHEAASNTKANAQAQAQAQKKTPLKKDVKFKEAIEILARTPSVLETNSSTSLASFGSPPTGAAPRRTPGDYKPPESFLQTMDRPGPGRTLHPISGTPQGQGQGQQPKQNVLADLWSL